MTESRYGVYQQETEEASAPHTCLHIISHIAVFESTTAHASDALECSGVAIALSWHHAALRTSCGLVSSSATSSFGTARENR
jgi:hypothetical protein